MYNTNCIYDRCVTNILGYKIPLKKGTNIRRHNGRDQNQGPLTKMKYRNILSIEILIILLLFIISVIYLFSDYLY